MKNEKLEKYISDLSPELQEKARACKTKEELLELAAENDVELSDDALEAVTGGGCFDFLFPDNSDKPYHKKCDSELSYWGAGQKTYYCNKCKKFVDEDDIEYK